MIINRDVIKEKVLKFLKENYDLDFTDPNENLFESGLVDSMALIIMSSYFEKEFGIKFNTSDIVIESFSTLNKIIEGIDRKLND